MRRHIQFMHRGKTVTVDDFVPRRTLLDYLRLDCGLIGTKEGCAEGDCGACTVALGRIEDGQLIYRPVNSCISFVGQLDGAELITVEDLSQKDKLHPVQQAFVDHHASQCGFCTPGFIMALFALYHTDGIAPSRDSVRDWLAGNLCRCTGYRPIIDAAMASCFGPPDDVYARAREETKSSLEALDDGESFHIGDASHFFASPVTITELAQLRREYPDAIFLAGGTDVGLWVTRHLRDMKQFIWLGRVKELSEMAEHDDCWMFGAGVTYEQAAGAMARIDPDLGELWRRIGGRQIRAVGTIGGNVANGSPIGDTTPALIALGAELRLVQGDEIRSLPIEDFYLGYQKLDLLRSEFLAGLIVPKLQQGQHFRCYKLSKRVEQDISAVMGAFRFTIESEHIVDARIGYGGMAATPMRAIGTESALIGARPDNPTSWRAALDILQEEFSPISDMRASADYRRAAARSMLMKALTEIGSASTQQTRLFGHRVTA